MSLTAVESSLLWLGMEDYTGLWDARHEVSAAFPELDTLDALAMAKGLLLNLARGELITLYRCVGTLASGDIAEIPLDVADEVLADSQFWEPPQAPLVESVWYATTEAGDSVYRRALGIRGS